MEKEDASEASPRRTKTIEISDGECKETDYPTGWLCWTESADPGYSTVVRCGSPEEGAPEETPEESREEKASATEAESREEDAT